MSPIHPHLEVFRCDVIPNGIRLKQNFPKGVIKVVSKEDSWASSTCQNPELASSFEKNFAPPICARLCSTEGRIWHSRQTLSFSLVRSTQILTLPFGFGTTTIPAHHSVGCFTLEITPRPSILWSSAFTFGRRGRATLLGVVRAKGLHHSSVG